LFLNRAGLTAEHGAAARDKGQTREIGSVSLAQEIHEGKEKGLNNL